MRIKILCSQLLLLLSSSLFIEAQVNLRGWFDAGQTWLVWEDSPDYSGTYTIYSSPSVITNVNQAEQIGRIFREDGEGRLLKKLSDTHSLSVPDGSGGVYTLEDNEVLFVYTPGKAGSVYFVVLSEDIQSITSENHVGALDQSIDTIQCHLQVSGEKDDFPFRVFAHWIDGSIDYDSGRADYPVMGNQYFNGTPHLFRIWEYPEGERPELLPLSVFMHGGGGWFGNFCPCSDMAYKTYMVSAMVFCPDDGIDVLKSGNIQKLKNYWIGYWKDYNRFVEPESQPVPDEGMVVNYTMRRIIWELEWLIRELQADPERISLMGGSMGARGANYLSRAYPEKFSAWLSLSPGIEPQPGDPLFGSAVQNLKTNFPGNPGVMEVMDLSTVLSENERDIPFGKIVGGRADNSRAALSPEVVQAYKNVNDKAHGAHIYWDDRGHVFTAGSYWSDSYRLSSMALNSYTSNCSYPAFFNDDQDFNLPGRQPVLGTGMGDGDIWGTWGGYYTWDPDAIVDSPTLWKSQISLVASSDYSQDIPGFDSSKTDLAIRRPQYFKPEEGSTIYWALTRLSDSRVMQTGQETVGINGLVSISDINVYKEICEIKVSDDPAVSVQADRSDRSCPALRFFPEPDRSSITLHFNMVTSGNLNITMVNLAGQPVAVLVDEYKSSGSHTFNSSIKDLKTGIYICRLIYGQTVHVGKVFINH